MQKLIDFEIINHGPNHAQYFPGYGTAFTDFDFVVTGVGTNAKAAYKDAVQQLYMSEIDSNSIDKRIPKRPRGIRQRDCLKASEMADDYSEYWWYVSILAKLK